MGCQEEQLLKQVIELYEKISRLESLKPSKDVNTLFTQLVLTCLNPSKIDVRKLPPKHQEMRSKLLRLCGEAEGHLEEHYSTILANSYDKPLNYLHIFPYFNHYLKHCLLEYNILTKYSTQVPNRFALVGSGPLPLTSIILALRHLPTAQFDNYDLDPAANEMATQLVNSDPNLASRMRFHTKDVMSIGKDELEEYDVVFLAALVGLDRQEKIRVIQHLDKNMAPGSTLMIRSAHKARAFLYPIVDPDDVCGFEVLLVFHPTDEVINSVVIARKPMDTMTGVYPIDWEQQ